MKLNWNRRYRAAAYVRSALWVIPFVAIALQLVFATVVHAIDAHFGWRVMGLGLSGAQAMFGAIITLALSFVVFTFGSLLVAIQVASGQYTPRIIATTLLRDNVIRFTAGLFVFTLLFAIRTLNRIEEHVPQLACFVGGMLGFASLVSFLYLIDHAARMLRPVSLIKKVSENGIAVVEWVYPQPFDRLQEAAGPLPLPSPADRTVLHRGSSAIVLAVDLPFLTAEAERLDGVIEFVPQVGDFVGGDEPLFLLHGGAMATDETQLRESIAFGSERTIDQDPLFAVRVLVDIAIKALSKAINDPTTAVLAIDQLQRMLRCAGRRNLRSDRILDRAGKLRVVFRTPDWEDFVHLACCEIRFYGAENLQIARRLRAMLVTLAETLPAERRPALMQQLDLLDRMSAALYTLPEDLALARIPDSQGLGGTMATSLPQPAPAS
jgi:uncharacterized membrane protein